MDAYGKSCSSPEACYNDHVCKHQRRVMFACGMRPIPSWVNRDGLDSRLGQHVAGSPHAGKVATDGGPSLATSDETDNGRPADCQCNGADRLTCFVCWMDGFDNPNPNSDGDTDA